MANRKKRHAAPKIRRSLWILLIGAGILGLILAGIGFYSQTQRLAGELLGK